MNPGLRSFALVIGASITLAACSDDKTKTADVLAQDSTLALEVMTANTDSLSIPTDTSVTDTLAAAPSAAVAPAPAPSTSVAPRAREEVSERVTPRTTSRRRVAASRRTSRTVNERSVARAPVYRAPVTRAPSESRPIETTPMRATATIPAGTDLSLAAGQRICASMSRVGDTFTTTFSDDVMGPAGVVIPKGTVATAQIASTTKDIELDMQSMSFAGNTYSLASDVTYAEVERVRTKRRGSTNRVVAGAGIGAVAGGVIGGNPATTVLGAAGGALAGAVTTRRSVREDYCIPTGGRINVKLSESLKIALSE